jgi:hypothetical protein
MSKTRSLIARVRARLALATAVEDLEVGAAAGAAAALLVLAAERIGLVALNPWWAAAAGAGVALAVPAVGLALRRRDERAIAAAADERLGLRERVSTALWWQRQGAAAGADLGGFGPLVVADAETAAARVAGSDLARAFRPRLLRRPLVVAAGLVAACGALLIVPATVQAVTETDADRVARLADANRIAEVARKLREEAKRVEEAARERKETNLEHAAREVTKRTEPLVRAAPQRSDALKEMTALADMLREQARKAAGMRETADMKELGQADRALERASREPVSSLCRRT